MHPEELCKMIQCNKDNVSDEMEYEREMTSHEYLDMYFGTKYFSNRKFLRLVQEERRQRNKNKRR